MNEFFWKLTHSDRQSSATMGGMGPTLHISRTFANELDGFSNLESFEISLEGFQLAQPPAEDVLAAFDSLENIESWKLHCPTLRRVTLYGTELK